MKRPSATRPSAVTSGTSPRAGAMGAIVRYCPGVVGAKPWLSASPARISTGRPTLEL